MCRQKGDLTTHFLQRRYIPNLLNTHGIEETSGSQRSGDSLRQIEIVLDLRQTKCLFIHTKHAYKIATLWDDN